MGQAAIERCMLHVDDDRAQTGLLEEAGDAAGFLLGGHAGHADVTGTIGEQDHQRADLRIAAASVVEHLPGEKETIAERRFAADRQIGEGALCQFDAAGWGEDETCLIALKHDQSDLVATLVGIDKQAKDGAFGGLHAFAGRHAPTGIYHKEDQVAGTTNAYFALKVTLAQLEGKVVLLDFVALPLVRGGGAQRGIKRDVLGAVAGRARLDIAAALAIGARVRALARALTGHLI